MDFAIGNVPDGPIYIAQPSGAQANAFHLPGSEAGVDDITNAILIFDQHEDAREKVAHKVLCPETQRDAGDSSTRDESTNVQAQFRKNHRCSEAPDDNGAGTSHETCDCLRSLSSTALSGVAGIDERGALANLPKRGVCAAYLRNPTSQGTAQQRRQQQRYEHNEDNSQGPHANVQHPANELAVREANGPFAQDASLGSTSVIHEAIGGRNSELCAHRSPTLPKRRYSAERMERIGVLGGTFDPIHIGHLVAALDVRDQLDLDEVRLVVANEPWQKLGRLTTPPMDRLAMVEAAVCNVDGLVADRCELDRGGPTYTADTLEDFSIRWPDAELFLIVGSDVAADLDTWKRHERVQELATLVVVNRGEQPATVPAGWKGVQVAVPRIGLSSTQLRERILAGQTLDYLVPAAAIQCMRDRNLYGRE